MAHQDEYMSVEDFRCLIRETIANGDRYLMTEVGEVTNLVLQQIIEEEITPRQVILFVDFDSAEVDTFEFAYPPAARTLN